MVGAAKSSVERQHHLTGECADLLVLNLAQGLGQGGQPETAAANPANVMDVDENPMPTLTVRESGMVTSLSLIKPIKSEIDHDRCG
jgi:hypothetical protein